MSADSAGPRRDVQWEFHVPVAAATPTRLRPGSLRRRLPAVAIDTIVSGLIAFALQTALVSTGVLSQTTVDAAGDPSALSDGMPWQMLLLYAVADLLYAPTMLALADGRTVGKAIMGLRVVTTGGNRIGYRRAVFRELVVKDGVFGGLGAASGSGLLVWSSIVLALLNALSPLTNERRRALHDFVGETRVVRG